MAGAGPGDLQALAEDLLDAAADALDSIPVAEPGLLGTPARHYVSPGQPPIDCEQLVVWSTALADRFTRNDKPILGKINVPNLSVMITRCIPIAEIQGKTLVFPSNEDCTEAARQTNADAWALWNHLWNAIRADQFLTSCGEFGFATMTALPQQGRFGGWQLTVQASYDGYEEDIGS